MKCIYFIVYILLLFPHYSIAQTGNKNADAVLDSSRKYLYSDKTMSYRFAAELKQIGIDVSNESAVGYAHHIFGIIDENHGDNEAALGNYNIALAKAENANDKLLRLKVLIALSNYYINSSETDIAILTCRKGIEEAQSIKDNELVSQFYNNLSLAHSYIGDYKKALEYSDKSIELKKGLQDELSLANAYLNKGLLLTNTRDYKQGFVYYNLAENLYEKNSTYHALCQTNINYAWDYTDLKRFNKARYHLTKAMDYAIKSDDKIREAGVWNVYGYFYKNAGYIDSVAYALDKGLKLSLEAKNKRNALIAYKELSSHYQTLGNYKLAFENINKALQLKDSIFDESKLQLAQSLNVRYETDQKEQEIKLLKANKERQQLILIVIILLVLIVAILAVFLFRKYRKQVERKKSQELQEQKELERIRIARDMHDEIGAGLTRIVMWAEQAKVQVIQNDSNYLIQSLDKITKVSREISHNIGEIIWSLNPKYDTLDNLISYIRNYILNYFEAEEIKSEINFPDDVPKAAILPEFRRNVFLVIKEALHNVLKHSRAKELNIDINISSKTLTIVIVDSGIGFNADVSQAGNGLVNMKKRIEDLGGVFQIESNSDVPGTRITINDLRF